MKKTKKSPYRKNFGAVSILAVFLLTCLVFLACKVDGSKPATLVKIEITGEPGKTIYTIGEELNLAGLTVKAFYSDNSNKTVTDYTVSGYDPMTLGPQTITVSYKGKDVVFTVQVNPAAAGLLRIEITNPPDTLTYTVGEELDLSGLVVTAFYDDETDEVITAYTVSGYNPLTIGPQTITVIYEGEDAVFTVQVNPVVTLTRIEVTNPPDTLTYTVGDVLDLTGLVVTAFYDDNSDEVITAYTVSGYDPLTLGPQTITVSYEGEDAVFTVQVNPVVTLTRIEITNPPDTLTYTVGDVLDLTGLVVTAFYSDNSDEVITSYTVSGYDPMTLGPQTITVSYEGEDAVFTVQVKEIGASLITMEKIPAGSFIMGSPSTEAGRNVDEDLRTADGGLVTLTKGFYMGIYPITQEQYFEVKGVNPSSFSSTPDGAEIQEKRPVERVTFYDAVEFCNMLSDLEGLTPVYSWTGRTTGSPIPPDGSPSYIASMDNLTVNWDNDGYRLPTEAEWEYACRAGTDTPYYTGGDTISDDNGWYLANSNNKTHQVGLKPANPWGLYDMTGNIFEWCWDWYGSSVTNAKYNNAGGSTDPKGVSSGTNKIMRGGTWNSNAANLRSAARKNNTLAAPNAYSPGYRGNLIGFRVVRLAED